MNSKGIIANRLEAERVVKWIMYNKKQHIHQVRYIFKKCQTHVTVALQRCQIIPKSNVIAFVDAL